MLLVTLALAAPLPPPTALPRSRDAFKHASAAGGAVAADGPPPPPHAADGWDVTHYVLDVRIDPAAPLVTGRATIEATRVGTGDLLVHANGPVIGEVRVDGAVVTPTVGRDGLLLAPAGGSTVVDIAWTYAAAAPNGIQWGRDVVFSFHEPNGARTWLPVHDHPADKATLAWIITAPDAWVVAANGVLESADSADGWTTWRYTMDTPIATYLMVVHLADYVVTESGDDIPIYTWAYRGREAEAAESFAETAEMLALFQEMYGAYPFPSYGNAMAPFGGAMEHTTCVTFSDELVGTEYAEIVNAHELGHHWWGDNVTLGDWADIWLNEGFATYTELLWYEHRFGAEGRVAYAAWLAESFFEWQDLEGQFPVYDPLYMWGGVVYDKGGLVVHMLRGVLGDDVFFEALRAYEEEFRLGTAVTADLQASFQRSSGEDLDWFFDTWVYGVGEPVYTWGWAARRGGGDWQLDLQIAQDLPEHRMRVPMRVTYADGTVEDVSVVVAGAETRVSLCRDVEPVSVELDPELWVLRAGEVTVDIAAAAGVCGDAERPAPDAPAACGCATGSPAGGAATILAAAVLARRRRARL